jgi:hypothetical protein
MNKEIYEALEKRIQEKVSGVKQVDWFYNQYEEGEEGNMVWVTPSVYLQFLPIEWQDLGSRVQSGDMTLLVHLATDSGYENKQRITVTEHLELDKALKNALHGWGCPLSYTPSVTNVAGTANDGILINRLTRKGTESDHALRECMVTIATYTGSVYDYSSLISDSKDRQEVLLTLDLTVDKVPQLP